MSNYSFLLWFILGILTAKKIRGILYKLIFIHIEDYLYNKDLVHFGRIGIYLPKYDEFLFSRGVGGDGKWRLNVWNKKILEIQVGTEFNGIVKLTDCFGAMRRMSRKSKRLPELK